MVHLSMKDIPHFMTKIDPKTTSVEVMFGMIIAAQRAMLEALEKEVLLENEKALLCEEKALLCEENALLKQKLFGRSSKKRNPKKDVDPAPMEQVFDEATVMDASVEASNDFEQATAPHVMDAASANTSTSDDGNTQKTSPKRGRKPLPAHLPREDVIHDIPAEENLCACGCLRTKMGEEVSEQLEVIPAQLKVIRHVRYKYGCRNCEEGIKTAPMPPQPIPKGIPTAGLLAHVCVAKFDDHLPLYRQSEIWERLGVDLPRSTLSGWLLGTGALLLPMVPLMQDHIIYSAYVNADETTVQVLRTPDKSDTSKSYMWVYMTGKSIQQPAIVYEYQPSRHGTHAETFLEGFRGVLQTDGYSGYHAVTASPEVIAVGCWAHARHKFHDVWVVLKKEGVASKAIDIIGKLYDMERWLLKQNSSADQIKCYRQEHAKPVLEAFKTWLLSIQPQVPPKGLLSKAINYTLNQWECLIRYLEDGNISIDNNAAERQIRPFTVGRKNWLFMGSVAGAKAASVIYSLIETAKANGLNPEAYLRYILEQIPSMREEDYPRLLPWNVTLPDGYVEIAA